MVVMGDDGSDSGRNGGGRGGDSSFVGGTHSHPLAPTLLDAPMLRDAPTPAPRTSHSVVFDSLL